MRFFRILLWFALNLSLPAWIWGFHGASAAPFADSDNPQASEVIVPYGGNAFIQFWFDGSPTRVIVYEGDFPDKSNPLADSNRSAAENTGKVNWIVYYASYQPPPLTESTKIWFSVCNDFGCLDSTTITLTVEGEPGPEPGPGPEPETGPFSDAEDLGDGWMFSAWFGSLNMNFYPWIFHADHQWMYIWEESTADNLYCYDLNSSQWFFSGSSAYPSMYSFARNGWVYFVERANGVREFSDLQTGEFFSLE